MGLPLARSLTASKKEPHVAETFGQRSTNSVMERVIGAADGLVPANPATIG